MASRNSVRQYDVNAYYHVYNRGVEKRRIFIDNEDYAVFLSMLKRHLDTKEHKDRSGRPYARYEELELLAFCLMPNHFHLFIYQADEAKAFTELMRSVSTAYTMYFNRKYGRVGHLFQDRFKASRISDDSYLSHISRYIHLNPGDPLTYEWSSLPYFLGEKDSGWMRPERVLEGFSDAGEYLEFVMDYTDHKQQLDEIKSHLADK